MDGPCKAADPKPELMALAKTMALLLKQRRSRPPTDQQRSQALKQPQADDTQRTRRRKFQALNCARRANDEARASGTYVRSNLGAGMLAALGSGDKPAADTCNAVAPAACRQRAAKAQPAVKIINAPKPDAETADAAPAAPHRSTGQGAGRSTRCGHQVRDHRSASCQSRRRRQNAKFGRRATAATAP